MPKYFSISSSVLIVSSKSDCKITTPAHNTIPARTPIIAILDIPAFDLDVGISPFSIILGGVISICSPIYSEDTSANLSAISFAFLASPYWTDNCRIRVPDGLLMKLHLSALCNLCSVPVHPTTSLRTGRLVINTE